MVGRNTTNELTSYPFVNDVRAYARPERSNARITRQRSAGAKLNPSKLTPKQSRSFGLEPKRRKTRPQRPLFAITLRTR